MYYIMRRLVVYAVHSERSLKGWVRGVYQNEATSVGRE